MKRSRKVTSGLIILVILMQVIQPQRNLADGPSENDISKVYTVPENVRNILVQKCYDCHSNNTRYPWYAYVQPIGWWMAAHVYEGREHLDFSEFKTYSEKKAIHKLGELSDAVTEGWMPIDSYLFFHKDAKIKPQEAEAINAWLKTLPIKVEVN